MAPTLWMWKNILKSDKCSLRIFRKMRRTFTHAVADFQRLLKYPNKKRGITFMTPPLILVAYHLSGGFQFSQGDL